MSESELEMRENATHPLDEFTQPVRWSMADETIDGRSWRVGAKMTVIASVDRELDGKRWVHVSVARPDRLPTWEELMMVRNTLLGADRRCVQVLPDKESYVDIHHCCLHFWYCVDGETVPDFSRGSGSI